MLLQFDRLTGEGMTIVLLVAVALLALNALLFALLLLGRRQSRQDVRRVVQGLEELRSGRGRPRVEVDPRSPLAVAADAVNRLSHDLSLRWSEVDSAREQLRAFLDAARDYAVVGADADWDIRSFSPGASTLFGWSEDDVRTRPATILFDEDAWKELLPKLARRSVRELGVETRSVMVRRDGSTFHASLLVRQLRDAVEETAGYLLVLKDVSPEVRLEEELEESESRYRSLVEGLAEGVFIVQEGRIVYANPAMCRLLGAESRDLESSPLREWVATRDVLVVAERLESLGGREGEREDLHCTLAGPGGEHVAQVRIHGSAIQHQGKPAALVSVFDETTERQIEVGLRENEARLDAVLEATSDGILVVTDAGDGAVVRMTNRAFLGLFGIRSEELLGVSEPNVMRLLRERGGGAEGIAEFLGAAAPAPRSGLVTLEGPIPRVVEMKVAPLIGRSGERLGRVLACRDVTDQKTVERRLEASAEELRRNKLELEESYASLDAVNRDLTERTRRLDELNQELKTLDEMKSNLLANVSHELQTPLVSIRGYTEMILKERLGSITDEQRRGLSLSLKNIDRLIAMIDNLLAFSRMDKEAVQLKITTFALRPVIEEALALLREKLESKGITCGIHVQDPSPSVRADRDKVLQVFLNLFSNGVKFNRDGGRLEVAVKKGKPGYALVQVKDTGFGIPPEARERIFDRFFQVERPEADPQKGTGIGLAIVRNILRLHGCTIRVESEVGRGSTFSFTLPLAAEKPTADRREPVTPEAGTEPTAPARGDSDRQAGRTEEGRPGGTPRLRIIRRGSGGQG
jgi:PAS domain S-box-containing protein